MNKLIKQPTAKIDFGEPVIPLDRLVPDRLVPDRLGPDRLGADRIDEIISGISGMSQFA